MLVPNLANARWIKSSYSHEGTCVEVALGAAWAAMRDSKNPEGPALVFDRAAMEHFLAGVRSGEFDL
jgi:hypothetical protein